MSVKNRHLKKAAGITLAMTLYALLFFVVVMVITGFIRNKYGSAEYISPAPSPTPKTEPATVTAELLFVTEEDGSLYRLLLLETDSTNVQFRLNVIPLDTRLELSATLYKECVHINVSTPQFTTVTELYKCFKTEAVEMTARAVRELLPFTPDFVTVMQKADYVTLFKEDAENYSYDGFLAEGFWASVKNSGGLYRFICAIYGRCKTDKTLDEALFMLETYENLNNFSVSCRLIPGVRHSNGYVVNGVSADYYKK